MLTGDVDVDIASFDLGSRLSEVRALARTAMTDAGQPGGMLVAKYLHEVTELNGLLALGAHRGDQLVGMLVGWPTASREWWPRRVRPALIATHNEHWLDDAFEIAELHVHPDVQRNGLASALLDEVKLRVDQPRAVLGTNALNNQRARRFYHHQGFRTLTGPFEWLGLDMRIFVLGTELPESPRA